MPLRDLDQMAVDDVATSPQRIVTEIHRQLGEMPPPIPVEEVARGLGIAEIRQEVLKGFEGALITDPERGDGEILINRTSGAFRKRFSVAHELGHFLCAWHKQSAKHGFACTPKDMASWSGDDDQHQKQEAEANLFAIELLAPVRLLAPSLKRLPELEHVLSVSERLQLSKEAAARRYVSLHRESLAAIFCQDGRYVYAQRGGEFPFLPFTRGDTLPALPRLRGVEKTSDMEDADAEVWFTHQVRGELAVQVHAQQERRAIVLLHLTREPEEDDH